MSKSSWTMLMWQYLYDCLLSRVIITWTVSLTFFSTVHVYGPILQNTSHVMADPVMLVKVVICHQVQRWKMNHRFIFQCWLLKQFILQHKRSIFQRLKMNRVVAKLPLRKYPCWIMNRVLFQSWILTRVLSQRWILTRISFKCLLFDHVILFNVQIIPWFIQTVTSSISA